MHLTARTAGTSLSVLFLSMAWLAASGGYPAAARQAPGENLYLWDLERSRELDLTQARQACADGDMPRIRHKIETDKNVQLFDVHMPETSVYCLKALSVAKAKGWTWNLYMNIAMQEQGYTDYDTAGEAVLLKNNEAGRTWGAIFRAANAGAASYTSITDKPRPLPCSLALDAGFTWVSANSGATVPIDLTQIEAGAIAKQCYDPAVTQITVRGTIMSPQKAGLIAGAWMARNGF